MANLVGTTLGQYKITALLGEGGMADVYRARQESLKRDVAIKVMRLQLSLNPEFLMRFQREAQTIALLRHPHIIRIYDYGEQQENTYLVMDYLTGGSLGDRIKNERSLSPSDAAAILDQIASALDHAHRRGIIHRDLKPHNILFDESGAAILTDFGIAKLMDDTSIHTQTGVAIGTPAYMAPEQWQGLPIDARTDVYALGVILYEMLTGHVPYTGTSPVTVMHRALNEQPRPLAAYRSDLSEAVEAVMVKSIAKTQESRYQTAGELAAAFRQALSSVNAPAQPNRQVAYEDERTISVDRQTPPKQPAMRSPAAEQASHRKTEQDFPPANSPAPRTQASSARSRGFVTAIGALAALVLLGAAGALLLPRLLPAAQVSTDTPTATASLSPTPLDTPTLTFTPSASPTETATETPTTTIDPLIYTETARVQAILQTIDAITSQTVQAQTQAAEFANQTAAALRVTDDFLRNQAQIAATVEAALGQTSTAQAALRMAAMTGTAIILAPTQTMEAELTVQAGIAAATSAMQTAVALATASADAAIAQAIQGTQTAVVMFSTQTAEAEKQATLGGLAGSRTAAANSADMALTARAATFAALMGGNDTPVPVANIPLSTYTQQMVSLLDQGVLNTITGKVDFRLSTWQSKATGTQTTSWDQWSTKSYTDYVMGVQFRWGTNIAADGCGITAHVSGQSLYSFAIDHRGSFKWQTIISKDQVFTATNSKSANTNAVNEDVNTMILVVRGDTYQVVVNGQLVTTIQDTTVTQGNIGVLTYVENTNATASCNYEDMWVWDLNATEASVSNNTVTIDKTNTLQQSLDTFGDYSDFVIRAQMSLDSSGVKDGCGFVFRRDDGNTNYYWFVVYPKQRSVLFDELADNKWITSTSAKRATTLNANAGAANDIVLVVQGNTFTAYANGKLAVQFQDATLKSGQLRLSAVHFDEGNSATCSFEDVWVWTLDN